MRSGREKCSTTQRSMQLQLGSTCVCARVHSTCTVPCLMISYMTACYVILLVHPKQGSIMHYSHKYIIIARGLFVYVDTHKYIVL